MRDFAKLIETDRGQVLALRQDGDDGPEIRVFFKPAVDILGLCSIAVSGFGDDEQAEEKADATFSKLDAESIENIAFKAMDEIESSFGEAAQ